ncbi:response regulator transcription factor [Lacrimispora saccharolytica]|uniref:Stage 0 sporulation protein A homolog n=1 Tax=Lacrimispora saccharolytica (strain ATCC 35040 / DSM 2544 / NRCC 2533 / WM1) TaxID=610130 RepID=D9R573_LACSW|nr:response regulator transcription factor [Lacrimispora saccharolytica]ADL05180.1 two component transcriptional regulator, winged helix family [[Clostridium] saccharolyticum WM1]QRV20640.1 response regulator transcription factor [Lacrimispora saccharolytica]
MSTAQQILVVDDDADIREVLRIQLENKGYSVWEAVNGNDAVAAVSENPDIDLIILDIMMPGLSGIDACTQIRKITSAPVLFLTAKSKESDKTAAYENGGDDYLVKPFSQAELLMKVRSLLRRYVVYKGKTEPVFNLSEIRIQDILIDTTYRFVYRENQKIELTDTEFQVLMYLVRNRGKAKDAQAIYEGVWNDRFLPSSTNTVMVHILKLRKKLELDFNNPAIIRTVWGKGYQIDEA